MIRHYKPNEESNKEDGIRSGFSDPTPTLPEREGERFESNESFTADEADSQNISEIDVDSNESVMVPEADSLTTTESLSEVNKPVISGEADSLPRGEGQGGVQKPGYITANPYTYPLIKDYRKDLKDHQTEAELLLWEFLRNKKTGHKIRRQHVIYNYISDFICLSKKVVIEIDGEIHKFQKEQDEKRTSNLNKYGYEVIRFSNDEVLNSPYQVAQKIKIYLNNRPD